MAIRKIDNPDIHAAFRVIYRAVLHLHNSPNQVTGRFISSLKRTLRSQGLVVTPIHELPHCLRINECLILYIISIGEDVPSISEDLRKILKSEESVDSGYVLQLASCPLWKKVQVSANNK